MSDLPPPSTAVIVDRSDVRVHTFTSPESFLANSTHVIESANSLVVVDGQFVVPYAKSFRQYVDELGKPIDRVILSHAHVDHFFGIGAAFEDVPVHAPAATIATLEHEGEQLRAERAGEYGPLVPERIVVPQHPIAPGREVIDGVTYEFSLVTAAECDAQLVIVLPDLAVTIAQDLLYSNAHLYVTREMDNWVSVLQTLARNGSTAYLAGHGPTADGTEIQRTIGYLELAQQTLATTSDPQAFRAALLAAYPERTGAAILDICIPRLFAQVAAGHA